MKQKKPQTATNRNRVSVRVYLRELGRLARTAANTTHGGNLSAYLVDLIRRDTEQRAA